MENLADMWYKKFEEGEKVGCPKKDCEGLLVKVSGWKFEQTSEVYWEQTNYYRCNINCKHVWKYLLDPLKKEKLFRHV